MNELSDKAEVGELIQYIVIKLGDEQYGINIKDIDNIVRMQNIRRIPKAEDYLKGVINIRGEIVPVISIRMKMGMTEGEETNATRIIIIKSESDEGLIGIIVDQVNQVLTISTDDIEKVDYDKSKANANFISGVGKYEGGLVSILNLNAISLSDKEKEN